MRVNKKIQAVMFFIFLIITSFFVFKYTISMPLLGHDEAYNLQIARSLNENFIYQNRYEPRKIHDPKISVGFPLHYLQLIFFKVYKESLESARLLTSCLIIFLFIIIYYISKNHLAPLYLFTFF